MNGFQVFSQLVFNGILLGSNYGVAAIGLSLIFGSMEIIFIAQGSVLILAAYATYFLFYHLHIDPFVSLVLTVPAFALLGFVLYKLLFSRVASGELGKNTSLLIAFGLMILLEDLMSVLWSPDTRAVRTPYTGSSLEFLGLQIPVIKLGALLLTIAATGAVQLWLRSTLTGKAVRSATEDPTAATLMGIYPATVRAVTFGIGICLAGLAGNVTALIYPFDPNFGFIFSLKALIAVALGGIGSIGGALAGGIILGVLESLSSYLLTGVWANAVSYLVFLLVLMLKPQGLFVTGSRKV
jgi:branched-chain amino acid transport system permease protein